MRTKNSLLMQQIVEYINSFYASRGFSPSLNEIALGVGVSKSTISRYLAEMNNSGLVTFDGDWRGVRTEQTQAASAVVRIPVVGTIACGAPLLAQQNLQGYLSITASFLGEGSFFALRAQGDSMTDAGIDEGDYVIIRRQATADEGQIVVALIDDEATLKRYYVDRKNKKIRLHPENSAYSDMLFDSVNIQGVAKKIIKDCSYE